MANNFDLKKFLSENKLTRASKALNEAIDGDSMSVMQAFQNAGINMNAPVYKAVGREGDAEDLVMFPNAQKLIADLERDIATSGYEDEISFLTKPDEIDHPNIESPEGEDLAAKLSIVFSDDYDYYIFQAETPAEIPGFEGTRDALGGLGIRLENKLTKASKALNENEDRDREYFQALNKEEKIRQVGEKLARKIGESSILDELIETAVNLVDEQPGTPALMALKVAVETMEEEYQYEGNVEGERIASQVLKLLSNPRSLNETTQPKNNFKKEMTNNFDLRKFLSENKLTRASKALNENVGNDIKKVAGTFMFSRFAPAQIKGELSPAHGTFFVVLYEETMNEAGIEVHQVSADQANAYLAYDRQLAASQGDPTQDAKLSAAAKAVGVPILGYESDLLVAPEGTTVQDVEALAGGDGETPAEIPGFEGTRDALGALGIRSENKLTRASKTLNEDINFAGGKAAAKEFERDSEMGVGIADFIKGMLSHYEKMTGEEGVFYEVSPEDAAILKMLGFGHLNGEEADM